MLHTQKVWQFYLIHVTVPQSSNQLRPKEVGCAVEFLLQVWCKKMPTGYDKGFHNLRMSGHVCPFPFRLDCKT